MWIKFAIVVAALGGAGLAPSAVAKDLCVEVEIGQDRAQTLDCLNQQLEQQVQAVRPPQNTAPIDAASPSLRYGGFNASALRQQYGRNFGRSTVPFRPSRTFGSPLRSSP